MTVCPKCKDHAAALRRIEAKVDAIKEAAAAPSEALRIMSDLLKKMGDQLVINSAYSDTQLERVKVEQQADAIREYARQRERREERENGIMPRGGGGGGPGSGDDDPVPDFTIDRGRIGKGS